MLQITVRILIPIVIVACGVGAMLALGSRQQETRPPVDAQQAPQVDTVPVQSHQGELRIEVDGVVSPSREIQVAAEVAGSIYFKADDCQAGSYVRQGSVLLEIDPRDYELEEERALKLLEQAQTEIEEVDVEIQNVQALVTLADQDRQLRQNELDRLTRLSSSISESDRDRAKREVVSADNARQTLENQLNSARVRRSRLQITAELAQSELKKARLDLSRSKILAPVDGVIVQDTVEQGDYVQKGSPLFVIEDTSSIEVLCNLQMEDLFWLWSQQTASAAPLDAAPLDAARLDAAQSAYQVPRTPATIYYQFAGRDDLRFSWDGTLTRFDGIGLDERTRTVPCRIEVDRPRDVTRVGPIGQSATAQPAGPPALVRGMYVRVVLHVRQGDDFVKVPDEAIQPGKTVWRVHQGQLEQLGPLPLIRGVEESDSSGRIRRFWLAPSVQSGLQPGDRLVITPLPGAYDGMQVGLSDTAAEKST